MWRSKCQTRGSFSHRCAGYRREIWYDRKCISTWQRDQKFLSKTRENWFLISTVTKDSSLTYLVDICEQLKIHAQTWYAHCYCQILRRTGITCTQTTNVEQKGIWWKLLYVYHSGYGEPKHVRDTSRKFVSHLAALEEFKHYIFRKCVTKIGLC